MKWWTSAIDLHFFSSTLNSTITFSECTLADRSGDGFVSRTSLLSPSTTRDIRDLLIYRKSYSCLILLFINLLEVKNLSSAQLCHPPCPPGFSELESRWRIEWDFPVCAQRTTTGSTYMGLSSVTIEIDPGLIWVSRVNLRLLMGAL